MLSLKEIATCAAKALDQNIKITYLPDWIRKGSIFAVRYLTPQKFYGPIEFFLSFMGSSHIGQRYGSDRLDDFYRSEAKVLSKQR